MSGYPPPQTMKCCALRLLHHHSQGLHHLQSQSQGPQPMSKWNNFVSNQSGGQTEINVHGGDSGANGYKSANRHKTPFAWIPASRSDATFDAVICTDTCIFTIQATVAAKHSVNAKGFETLERYLPKKFQKARKWCHVFVTNHPNTPTLRSSCGK